MLTFQNKGDYLLAENTAVNRGANLLSTSDIAHAVRWLGIEKK
ncbi:MAG TPA: hypothetical protein PLA27_12245 [Anaerolineales bacterium]|jgi:hypothetical protein|nr:hypothetical protein [Anaerolineales bacterium]